MSLPSSPGMPPQGARDPVELANERVCNLEAEKKGLLDDLSSLRQRCGVASELDIFIKLNEPGHEQYKPYHAELKGRLTSVDKQLESALKIQLDAAQAWREEQPQPSPDRDSRGSKRHGSGSTGSDSGSKRRRANDDAVLEAVFAECKDFERTSSGGKHVLLQRDCYSDSLEHIAEAEQVVRWETTPRRMKLFPVGGTPGVGKTTFRLWVLNQWLRAKKSQHKTGVNEWLARFNAVRYYHDSANILNIWINEEGAVCGERVKMGNPSTCTLLLLEWTNAISQRLDGRGQLVHDSVAIVTGSPGRFVKGSPATKETWAASPIYLPTWSTEELADVYEFSADLFHECGGVARLWATPNRPAYIQSGLQAAIPENFLKMLTGALDETSHAHRLLDINADGTTVGFISKAVADNVMARAAQAAQSDIEAYVSRGVATGGVFAKTFVGHLFEALFSSAFGQAKTGLTYNEGTNTTKIQLRERSNCVPFTESMQCEDDVLYKPEKRNFHGIDCFVLRGDTVTMLQITVGKTHTPVSEEHPDIKKLTKKFSNKKFLLVYVVPSAALAASFTVPPQGNPSAWTVRVGHPESERFAVYGDVPDVPLPTETPLRCKHCATTKTRENMNFASPSGLKTHERSCAQKKTPTTK